MVNPWLVSIVQLLRLVFLGPVWEVPLTTWRALLRSGWPRPLLGVLALPGAWGCALLAVGLLGGWPLVRFGPSAAVGLRGWSPVHRLLDEINQLGVLMQISAPLDQGLALLQAWVTLALTCTVFLSPLYLSLALREQRRVGAVL